GGRPAGGGGAGEPLSELELKARTLSLMTNLERAGAHVYIPRRDQDYAIVAGLRMLTLRHLVEERDGLYAAVPAEMPLLRYYAGSIAHLVEPAAGSAPPGLAPHSPNPLSPTALPPT